MNSFRLALLPKGVRFIIFATAGVWLLQIIPGVGGTITNAGALVPRLTFGNWQLWRLVSYILLHDPTSPFHILFNMLALWMFGTELEQLWGTRRFVTCYLLSGIGAGLFSVLQWHSVIIGASGAILALLTLYAIYYPHRTVLMFFIIPMPIRFAVVIIGALSLWGAAGSGSGDIAYLTHLGGIVIGILYYSLYPRIEHWWNNQHTAEKLQGATILPFRQKPQEQKNKGYFETVVDPLLKKISQHGIESLTAEERRKLDDASGRK